MKFFKCMSQNVSIVEEQVETTLKGHLKLGFKQKKSNLAYKGTTPRKSRGLSVQLDPSKDEFFPNNKPLVEYNKPETLGTLPLMRTLGTLPHKRCWQSHRFASSNDETSQDNEPLVECNKPETLTLDTLSLMNMSIVEEQDETTLKGHLKLGFKQKKSNLAYMRTTPHKSRGLSVQFDPSKDEFFPNNEPLVECNKPETLTWGNLPLKRRWQCRRFASSNDETSQDNRPLVECNKPECDRKTVTGINPGLQNPSYQTDVDSPLPAPHSQAGVPDNLNEAYTVHHPLICKSIMPSIERSWRPKHKSRQYLPRMAPCTPGELLNNEADETIVSFGTIYATDSQFGVSHVTPEKRVKPRWSKKDKPDFHERFPESRHNGTISHGLPSAVGSEPARSDRSVQSCDLKELGYYSLTRLPPIQEQTNDKEIGYYNRLVDYSLSSTLQSIQEPISDEQTSYYNRLVDYSLSSTLQSIQEPIGDEPAAYYNQLVDYSLISTLSTINEPISDDYTQSNNRHLAAKEPIGVRDAPGTDYFHLNGQEPYSESLDEGDMDVDIGTDEASSMEAGHLDTVTIGPECLFMDADDSQTVEKNRPGRSSRFTVTVFRGDGGFGFSMAAERPPIVSKVVKDSPADKSGVKEGDLMIKVGNRQVHKKSFQYVGNFIRTINTPYLVLELKRVHQPTEDKTSGCQQRPGPVHQPTEDKTSGCQQRPHPVLNKNPRDGATKDSPCGSIVEDQKKAEALLEIVSAPSLLELHPCLENMHLISHGNVYKCDKDGSWVLHKLITYGNVYKCDTDGYWVEHKLISHGHVYKCDQNGCWVEHQLFLFSELLLMASQRAEGSWWVSGSPIHVEDLAGLDFSRENALEFVLHLRTSATEDVSAGQPSAVCPSEGSTMVLRAASVQDMFVWKSLLEQRVAEITSDSLRYVIPT